MVELHKIATEQRNPNTGNIDTLSTLEMVKLINREDHKVAEAVGLVAKEIARAVDVIADRLAKGGRLIYCGAGTSGRLGILDAVECPPTYSTEPEMVQGLIAGGYPAIFKAVEGAEDSALDGGRETILRCAPNMAVSLYHRTDDLYALVNWIHGILPEHRLYLRRVPCIPMWDLNLFAVR